MEYLGVDAGTLAARLGVGRVTIARWRASPGAAHHRRVSRQSAVQLWAVAQAMAKEKRLSILPLKDFFSPVITRS